MNSLGSVPRAQAEQEARKPAATLSSSADCAHPPAAPAAPQIGGRHRLFILFLANHPLQIRAPLPCSFPTLNLAPPPPSFSSFLPLTPAQLPPPQPKKSIAIDKHLPELLLCGGVSIVCGRIWCHRSHGTHHRGQAQLQLSAVASPSLAPYVALWTRHMLRRTELHWSYLDFSPLA